MTKRNKGLTIILALALVIVLAFALVGCGKKGNDQAEPIDNLLSDIASGKDVITVQGDIVAGATDINITKGATLDLNGKTLDVKSFNMKSDETGEYTLKNGTIKSKDDIKVLMKNATINFEDVDFVVADGKKVIAQASKNTLNINGETSFTTESGAVAGLAIEEGTRVVVGNDVEEPFVMEVHGSNVDVENNSNADGNEIVIMPSAGGQINIVSEGNLDSVENNSPNVEISLSTPNNEGDDQVAISGSNSDAVKVVREISFYRTSKSDENMVEMFVYNDQQVLDADPVDWVFYEYNEEFLGWYTSPTFEESSKITFPYTVTADEDWFALLKPRTSFDAKFSVNLHNVSDGAYEDVVIEKTVKVGEDITVPTADELDLQGGWEVKNWILGDEVVSFPIDSERDVEFYAELKNESLVYTVEFVNGTDTVESKSLCYGSEVAGTWTLALAGHTFLGWFVGDTEAVFPHTVTDDITFEAKWDINEYTVTLHSGAQSREIVREYDNAILDDDCQGFNRPSANHVLVGWYTTETLDAGTKVEFPYFVTENTDFYAKWKDKTQSKTLTINANGGVFANGESTLVFDPTDPTQNVLVGNHDDDTIGIYINALELPTRGENWLLETYYGDPIFYTSSDCTGDSFDTYSYVFTGEEDLVLYLNWIDVSLLPNVTIYTNYGQVNDGIFDCPRIDYDYENEVDCINLETTIMGSGGRYCKYGYILKSWSTDVDGTNTVAGFGADNNWVGGVYNPPAGPSNLYAQYVKLPEITYYSGDGIFADGTTTFVGQEDIDYGVYPEAPTQEGKSFAGWFTEPNGAGTEYRTTRITTEESEDWHLINASIDIPTASTYYAHYVDEIVYTIHANPYEKEAEQLVDLGLRFADGSETREVVLYKDYFRGLFVADGDIEDGYTIESAFVTNAYALPALAQFYLSDKVATRWKTADGSLTLDVNSLTYMTNVQESTEWYPVFAVAKTDRYIYDANGGKFVWGDDEFEKFYSYYYRTSKYTERHSPIIMLDMVNSMDNYPDYITIESWRYESGPKREGYEFAGWHTLDGTVSGDWGDWVKENKTYANGSTFYAKWISIEDMTSGYEDIPQVTFDANGGKLAVGPPFDPQDIFSGDDYGFLDEHSRYGKVRKDGAYFLGWFTLDGTTGDWGNEAILFTDPANGNQYTIIVGETNMPITTDTTLYARWGTLDEFIAMFPDEGMGEMMY